MPKVLASPVRIGDKEETHRGRRIELKEYKNMQTKINLLLSWARKKPNSNQQTTTEIPYPMLGETIYWTLVWSRLFLVMVVVVRRVPQEGQETRQTTAGLNVTFVFVTSFDSQILLLRVTVVMVCVLFSWCCYFDF